MRAEDTAILRPRLIWAAENILKKWFVTSDFPEQRFKNRVINSVLQSSPRSEKKARAEIRHVTGPYDNIIQNI